jgi:hypothetical protein
MPAVTDSKAITSSSSSRVKPDSCFIPACRRGFRRGQWFPRKTEGTGTKERTNNKHLIYLLAMTGINTVTTLCLAQASFRPGQDGMRRPVFRSHAPALGMRTGPDLSTGMGFHGGPWEPEHGRFVGWVGALAETRHGRLRNAGFGNPAYLIKG